MAGTSLNPFLLQVAFDLTSDLVRTARRSVVGRMCIADKVDFEPGLFAASTEAAMHHSLCMPATTSLLTPCSRNCLDQSRVGLKHVRHGLANHLLRSQ